MGATNFPTVTDRSVQYPSRVQLTPVTGQANTYDVTAIPGTVESEGTLLNSTLFNQIRDNSIWPIANGGTGATTAAAARQALQIVDYIYPVGSIFLSVNNTSPQVMFSGTTWVSLGTDKFIRVADPSDTLSSGGSDSVTLATTNLPSHSHTISSTSISYAAVAGTEGNPEPDFDPSYSPNWGVTQSVYTSPSSTGDTGGGQAFDNRPAYVEIYAWKRTA